LISTDKIVFLYFMYLWLFIVYLFFPVSDGKMIYGLFFFILKFSWIELKLMSVTRKTSIVYLWYSGIRSMWSLSAFYHIFLFSKQYYTEPLKCDHNKRLITWTVITLRDFPCVNKHAKLILRHYHAKESESYFCDCVYSDQKFLKKYEILNLHKVNCDFPMVW